MNNIQVSCIIPTFNRALLLEDAIISTLNQTYPHWELIIVDDGSMDNTEDLVKQYAVNEPRIKYFKNPKKGGSAARNYGLEKASGEYIAFLDDDDISLPHRFRSQLAAAQKSRSNFIVSGYRVMERNSSKIIVERKLELKGKGAGFPSRWLLKKELIDKVGGFNEEFPSMQEIELSYRLSDFEVFALHNDIVTIINHTKNSVSKRPDNTLKGKILLIQRMALKMHPIEIASWYYTIAQTNYVLGKFKESVKYFKLAHSNDNRYNFKIALSLVRFSKWFYHFNFAKKIIAACLTFLGKYNFPKLVEHKVI